MRALVIYESMYGNTKKVALATAEGLRRHGEVTVSEVGSAPDVGGFDLVVAGGPTHAFSLSRASTREDAARKWAGGPVVSRTVGLREWAEGDVIRSTATYATFDTRIRRPRLPGSAAKALAKRLRARGASIVAPAESFWVTGTYGPLYDGEEARAAAWGDGLARAASRLVPTGGGAES